MFPIEGVYGAASPAKALRKTHVNWVGPSSAGESEFGVRFESAFESVMRGCLRPEDNWITEEIIRVYTQIHFEGWAHSAEVWQGDHLVGGTYGLAMGTCFCAESMFHRVTNASKIALWAMVEQCRRLGITIFDAQVMNPHLASLGAFEVPQKKYLRELAVSLQGKTPWS